METSGSRENTYVIHFSDSAMVSRAISRGYLTVNGIRINLSDEVKEQLTAVDRQAEADRMPAYNEYVMQHEMAVAKQQGETNPQLYAMAKSAATMAKRHNEPDKVHRKENESDSNEKNGAVQGVEWSQFEWKIYKSQMTVSLEDKVEVQGISEGRVGERYAADCSL